MTGRMYTVVVSGVASPAAAFDLFEFNAAAGKPLRIHRIRFSQTSEPTTEEEMLGVTIKTGHSTSGSGGSAPTPIPSCDTDTAAGFTAETMNTTQATGGSPVTKFEDVVNIRAGFDIAFSPEERPEIIGGGRGAVQITAPADAIICRATAWVEELG